jgi:hypothetical protein
MGIDGREELVKYVRSVVTKKAHELRENAAFGGEHGDGGAHLLESKLAHWIDGIEFAKTGKTLVFGYLIEQFDRERDPEYAEYLRLKNIFEKGPKA